MTYGVRFPTLAFITGGTGQANEGIPPQPFETFCYDSALMEAKIENFNVVPYTSVLPKEVYGNIVPVDEHKAIATGVGICWGKDDKGQLIGGWAAEYVEFFDTHIDDDIARGHAEMWLNKSLNHELELRGVAKHSEFQLYHNYLNITEQFGYCLTCLGFLNFENAEPAKI